MKTQSLVFNSTQLVTQNPDQLKDEGLQQFQRGAYDDALGLFETAVSLYHSQNNLLGQAEMLNNIGVIHRLRRNYDEAIVVLQQADAIFAELGELDRQGQALGNLGDLYAAQKNREKAARCYSNGAELLAKANEPAKQSQILRAFSLMRLRQGQWLEAMMHMEASLRVRPRLGPLRWLFRGMLRFVLSLLRGAGG
ncbi:MAG: tetratricopeptide repeat protein [Chloroflexi bacterium]|nr:tetratricopeptide repeat protein [Chloroflexota bacterium]